MPRLLAGELSGVGNVFVEAHTKIIVSLPKPVFCAAPRGRGERIHRQDRSAVSQQHCSCLLAGLAFVAIVSWHWRKGNNGSLAFAITGLLRFLRVFLGMFKSIVVLTGAGISAESGLQTFRGKGGLWRKFRAEELATPEAFSANPELVLEFYNERRRQLLSEQVQPNPAHLALARLEAECGDALTLVTQNVDNLHEKAGSLEILHMHGELLRTRCDHCGNVTQQYDDFFASDPCVQCMTVGLLRPDVVWFGEMPRFMQRIMVALQQCDVFIAVGTSGNVYPAAGFVEIARRAGAHTIELNPEPSLQPNDFVEHRCGSAGELLPLLVDELLG